MRAKIISSLEKCFLDETVPMKKALGSISMLKNERYSLQVCYDEEITGMTGCTQQTMRFCIESPLKDYIQVYKVQNIPSTFPCYINEYDENYLRTTPGLYPDLLEPITEQSRLAVRAALQSVWLEIEPMEQFSAGIYPIKGTFVNNDGEVLAEVSTEVEIIDAVLPAQDLIYTQWFYPDCLMQYYGVETYSEEHWTIIEAFMRNARKYGQTMILTPVLSPELDTYIGGYRPVTQLVDIWLENGQYRFCFDKLGRWIDLCDRVGIKYFEINHFFSQWGAAACPQVIATVDGEEKRIFGWDTPSDSDGYKAFLNALIPEMLAYFKSKNGADKRCYFHISDEPNLEKLENYAKASGILSDLVKGYPVIDALSKYDFYEKGLVEKPIPATNHIQPFLDHNVKNLWTYYCCVQNVGVANRFFAMPSARNRIIGTQLYKFEIEGFLHWGYNFYNSQFSYEQIDPFLCSDAGAYFPSGDAYSVYPGKNGTPWPSLRQVVFAEALQDLRALMLCQQLYGREKTMELLEMGVEPITFDKYPQDADYLLNLRRRINQAIADKVN